jgi:endonuclease/exonuclease/phosphatase (EEP) superfamily protein YafD
MPACPSCSTAVLVGRRAAVLGWTRRSLTLLVGIYLTLLVAALAAIALGSARSGWTALLRELSHLLFAPVPALLVLALIVRARVALLGLAVALLAFAACTIPQVMSNNEPADRPGPAFRVLTFNLGASRWLGQPEDTLRTIAGADPDVICLVEAPGNTLATVGANLHAAYPYQAGSTDAFVLSRFPLTEVRTAILSKGAKGSLQASLELDHRLITLTVVQLQRVDSYRGLRSGPRQLASTMRSFTTDERDAAVAELMGLIRAEVGTHLLVGDLNLTPTSQAYHVLRSHFQDAFAEAGWGLGHTYPTVLRPFGSTLFLPLVRIDYVLHSSDLVARRAWVGPNGGSDHLPLIADLAFR